MPRWLRSGALVAAAATSWPASAGDVAAGPPTEVAVTIYRAPTRAAGSIELDRLGGFALISEKRLVSIPAGVTRVRFEGVADGIEAASAILTGLPEAALEKNRDARLLSPSELLAAAVDDHVVLVRTDLKSGATRRTIATIRSDAQGVVFESADGIEALRCSGLTEAFTFSPATDLPATPTLSVLVHSRSATQATVTLAYLAHGFDWTANYLATLAEDGRTMDLGAWVTLANGNGVGFPAARAQVVAGRLNRQTHEVEPFALGGPIVAQCWPRGSTSDSPQPIYLQRAAPYELAWDGARMEAVMPAAAPLLKMAVTAQRVEQEQLGDLKLYRVPERTLVSSRQAKQIRLLDRRSIPITILYRASLRANTDVAAFPAERFLRTKNDAAHGLALPLPSGQVASFLARGVGTLLLAESPLRDVAVGEEFELGLGESSDVQVEAVTERRRVAGSGATALEELNRVQISNARESAIHFELRLQLPDGARLSDADHPLGTRNGQPLFELTIPAGARETLHYRMQRRVVSIRPSHTAQPSP
jgi:hypothetical protein